MTKKCLIYHENHFIIHETSSKFKRKIKNVPLKL